MGREVIYPDKKLFGPDIKNKVVCITGAGGSIGRELSLQIIALKPKMLVLFEINEFALFQIQQELLNSQNFNKTIALKSVLGSTLNKKLFLKTINDFKVDQIFHAAAYKHVPLLRITLYQVFIIMFSQLNNCDCAKI